jgi:hypothetical protein
MNAGNLEKRVVVRQGIDHGLRYSGAFHTLHGAPQSHPYYINIKFIRSRSI